MKDPITEERKTFPQRTTEDTTLILSYEVGHVARSIIYAGCQEAGSPEEKALLANALVELCDVVVQADILRRKILERANIRGGLTYHPGSLLAMYTDGVERQAERMEEFRKGKVT